MNRERLKVYTQARRYGGFIHDQEYDIDRLESMANDLECIKNGNWLGPVPPSLEGIPVQMIEELLQWFLIELAKREALDKITCHRDRWMCKTKADWMFAGYDVCRLLGTTATIKDFDITITFTEEDVLDMRRLLLLRMEPEG